MAERFNPLLGILVIPTASPGRGVWGVPVRFSVADLAKFEHPDF